MDIYAVFIKMPISSDLNFVLFWTYSQHQKFKFATIKYWFMAAHYEFGADQRDSAMHQNCTHKINQH